MIMETWSSSDIFSAILERFLLLKIGLLDLLGNLLSMLHGWDFWGNCSSSGSKRQGKPRSLINGVCLKACDEFQPTWPELIWRSFFYFQFNLAVNDLPEVSVEAKKLMSIHGEITTSRQPLCVEIYLRTADDDVMTLETWCIGVSWAA